MFVQGPSTVARLQIITANKDDASVVISPMAVPVVLAIRSLVYLGAAIMNV